MTARPFFLIPGLLTTMRTYISGDNERQDSVILFIPPGKYLLEYGIYTDTVSKSVSEMN